MSSTVSVIPLLIEALPQPELAFADADAEVQARGVVALFVRRIAELPPTAIEAIPENASNCPNCDTPVNSTRSPYCGEFCGEEAGFVRQLRRFLAEETILMEERQSNVGEKLWHVLGGGFPRRLSRLPEKGRQRVLDREGGKCEICGGPAIGLDHVGSG